MLKGILAAPNIRGTLLFVCCLYLIIEGGFSADLVASIFGISLLLLLSIFIVLVTLNAYVMRRRLKFETLSGQSQTHLLLSNVPLKFVTNFDAVSLWPGVVLQVKIVFTPGVLTALHSISGFSRRPRQLSEDIIFPHRGIWSTKHVEVSFRDFFGFCEICWKLPHSQAYRIEPALQSSDHLPIITSSSRPGDLHWDYEKRTGDPFELKPYNPADGVRKIVWKVYARSGELISRHPEAAMNPEGQVLIFCLAKKADDLICGLALDYIRKLEDSDLSVFLGTCAKKGTPVARNFDAAKELLIQTAWEAEQSTTESVLQSLEDLLTQVGSLAQDARIDRLLIFVSENYISADFGVCLKLAEALEKRKIETIFVKDTLVSRIQNSPRNKLSRPAKLVHNFFVEDSQQVGHGDLLPQFLQICSAKRWRVIS